MILALVICTIFYLIVLLTISRGVSRLPDGANLTEYQVSVVIAARNEEDGINDCLEALLTQDYPSDKFDITIVDDRSSDATAQIVSETAELHPQIKLIQITEPSASMAPKKYALQTGIHAASGEIILITDADTIPASGWIRSMVAQFETSVGLVAGFAPLDRSEQPNLFFKLLRLDSLALATVAAGSIGNGTPMTCTARSLGYRRNVFEHVGGFQQIAAFISGDDDLFMHLVRQQTDWEIRYAVDPKGMVSSPAVSSLHQFFNQRIRHASKGTNYSAGLIATLVMVYLLNVLLMAWPVISIFYKPFLIAGGLAFLIKSVTEVSLLNQFAKRFHVRYYLHYFPIAVFVHIPYVVVFGLLGQIGKFRWKGKTYSTKLSHSKTD